MQGPYGGQQGYSYGYPNSYFPPAPFPGYAPQADPYVQPWAGATSHAAQARAEHMQRPNSNSAIPGFVPAPASASMPRPKHSSRSQATTAGPKAPLKSAMKRGAPINGVPMQRERTVSDTRSRANSMTRTRSNTRAELVPGMSAPLCACFILHRQSNQSTFTCHFTAPVRCDLIISRFRMSWTKLKKLSYPCGLMAWILCKEIILHG
jgi:hypothetical protein